jgi:integrase
MGLPSTMAMSMLLRRLDATITVHGFRSSFRDWAAETGVEFSAAERCLAHAIGSNVTRSYLRTSMLELNDPFSRRGRRSFAARPPTT